MLCGFPREHEGNPLKLAATESVMVFSETLKALEVSHARDHHHHPPVKPPSATTKKDSGYLERNKQLASCS